MENCTKKIEKILDKFANFLGILSMMFLFALACVVFFNVVARYFFHYGNVAIQELEWHFFACMFMLGIGFALKEDAHVRVDVFYEKFSPKTKAIINILGTIFFIFPFVILVAYFSIDFVKEAFTSNEGSADPGGLSYRWIIKSLIPISYFFLFVCAIDFLCKNANALFAINRGSTPEFLQHNQNSAKEI